MLIFLTFQENILRSFILIYFSEISFEIIHFEWGFGKYLRSTVGDHSCQMGYDT